MALPSTAHNGVLLGYQIVCTATNGHTISVNVTDASATAHNLEMNTHYSCSVCGFTSVGCGPEAVVHISTYEECK